VNDEKMVPFILILFHTLTIFNKQGLSFIAPQQPRKPTTKMTLPTTHSVMAAAFSISELPSSVAICRKLAALSSTSTHIDTPSSTPPASCGDNIEGIL
jgi:hypothetical protein